MIGEATIELRVPDSMLTRPWRTVLARRQDARRGDGVGRSRFGAPRGMHARDYDMPASPLATGERFVGHLAGARRARALVRPRARRAVADRRREKRPTDIRIWPHHFDLGAILYLDPTDDHRQIGIGLSPGDGSYAEPYLYATPFPLAKDAALPSLPSGTWRREGWTGAVLTAHADRCGGRSARVPARSGRWGSQRDRVDALATDGTGTRAHHGDAGSSAVVGQLARWSWPSSHAAAAAGDCLSVARSTIRFARRISSTVIAPDSGASAHATVGSSATRGAEQDHRVVRRQRDPRIGERDEIVRGDPAVARERGDRRRPRRARPPRRAATGRTSPCARIAGRTRREPTPIRCGRTTRSRRRSRASVRAARGRRCCFSLSRSAVSRLTTSAYAFSKPSEPRLRIPVVGEPGLDLERARASAACPARASSG